MVGAHTNNNRIPKISLGLIFIKRFIRRLKLVFGRNFAYIRSVSHDRGNVRPHSF